MMIYTMMVCYRFYGISYHFHLWNSLSIILFIIFALCSQVVVAQLETEQIAGTLNLQKLWYFLRPIMHTMEILANISADIGKVN